MGSLFLFKATFICSSHAFFPVPSFRTLLLSSHGLGIAVLGFLKKCFHPDHLWFPCEIWWCSEMLLRCFVISHLRLRDFDAFSSDCVSPKSQAMKWKFRGLASCLKSSAVFSSDECTCPYIYICTAKLGVCNFRGLVSTGGDLRASLLCVISLISLKPSLLASSFSP